jgi:hypothetical protein
VAGTVVNRGDLLRLAGSETPYPAVLVTLLLVGAGNIAVVTPVTEIVLGSVPSARSAGRRAR